MNVPEIGKVNAIIEEVEASFNFIAVGLLNLKEQTAILSNNHVPLQLLASGFERVLKILLLIKEKHQSGIFPELQKTRKYFANYDNGHGIEKMLDELINYSETVELMQGSPKVIEEIEFIRTNPSFRNLIHILTEFSKQQRYYYIDTIVSDTTTPEGKKANQNPFSAFRDFILNFDTEVDVSQISYKEEEALKIRHAIVCIEKGTRAISRFFTHGFDDLGRQYYSNFSTFIFLDDKDLGSLSYTKKKEFEDDSYKPLHSNSSTFLKIKAFAKSKTIHASDYPDWAFTVDSVKIFSLNGDFFFVKIDNEIFALNGLTSSNYKIPSYHHSSNHKPRHIALFLYDEAKLLN